MFLFYTSDVQEDVFILKDEEHQHCTKVLRHRLGDLIRATDGKGNWLEGNILAIEKMTTSVAITKKEFRPKKGAPRGIAISPTKTPARLEWFVEKAVEIGIDEIILFVGKRTEKKSSSTTRIEKIVLSAMKQSLRTHLPVIVGFESVKEVVNHISIYDQRYIAHLESGTKPLSDIFQSDKSAVVLIGPEGDFTADEIRHCVDHGLTSVSLGEYRLRTETAGLVALFYIMG